MKSQKNELVSEGLVSEGIERAVNEYSPRFTRQTQRLLDEKAIASYHFIDASLQFNNGQMTYTHNTVFTLKTGMCSPKTFPVKTAQEAFEYVKYEILGAKVWDELLNSQDYQRGIADLEKYCQK